MLRQKLKIKTQSADLIIKLVSLFNVSPLWLLTSEGKMFGNNEIQQIRELDALDCLIINATDGMEEEKKKDILRHIEKEKLFYELLKERA